MYEYIDENHQMWNPESIDNVVEEQHYDNSLSLASNEAYPNDLPISTKLPDTFHPSSRHHSGFFQIAHYQQEQQDWLSLVEMVQGNEPMFTDPALEVLDNASRDDVFADPLKFQWDVSQNLPQDGSSAIGTGIQTPLDDCTSWATTESVPSTSTAATPASSSNTLEQQSSALALSNTTSAQIVGYVKYEAGSPGFVFKCSVSTCSHKDFARWFELKRHLGGFHAAREGLWCPVSTCGRSETFGNRPFPKNRADKLAEHMRNMHPRTWQ